MTFDSNTLQIYKYIDGDTGRPGANAMFEVQEVNVDLTKCSTAAETTGKKTCSGTVGETVMNNLTTGTTAFQPSELNADRIYKVTELVAPGEKADTTESAYEKAKPLYVVFLGNDARSADSKTSNGKYDNLVISDNKGNSGSLTVAVRTTPRWATTCGMSATTTRRRPRSASPNWMLPTSRFRWLVPC